MGDLLLAIEDLNSKCLNYLKIVVLLQLLMAD